MSKWEKVRLGDYIKEYSERNKNNLDIPVYSVTNSNGFCTEYFSKDVASKDKSTYKIVKKGFFAYNPSRINVGSVDWLRNQEKVIVSPLYNVFEVNDLLFQQYLYYYLKSSIGLYYINELSTGSVRDNLKLSTLGEFSIPLPPIEIQKQIAITLDKVTYIINLCKTILEKLDLLVKSQFVEMFGEPGKSNNEQGLISLEECCVINPKKSQDIRLKSGLQVSFVPMSAVSENGEINSTEIKEYDEVKTGFTYFAENDVLFAKITPCMENGKGAIAKKLYNGIGFGSTEFHVLRPIKEICDPCWLYTITSFHKFRIDAATNMTGSAGQRRVPASYLESYKVSLPPIELQQQFATFVEKTDKSKMAVKQVLEKAETLKKALMQEYFG